MFIMKISFFTIFLVINIVSWAQISINSYDMPEVNDTFRVSTTTNFDGISYDESGINFTWDFSELTPNEQRVDTFMSVLSTPIAYNAIFNNPMDENRATGAMPVQTEIPQWVSGIQLSDQYDFYKKSSGAYEKVGFGVKINGIPTPIQYDNPELIYDFVLDYNKEYSSESYFGTQVPSFGYFGQTIIRNSIVDGYGTLITPFGSFETIRVKVEINITDTVYYDDWGMGSNIPRPQRVEYYWLADNMGIPVLTVSKQGPVVTFTYQDEIMSTTSKTASHYKEDVFTVFPNPAKTSFHILTNIPNIIIDVVSLEGRRVNVSQSNTLVDVSDLASGIYIVTAKNQDNVIVGTKKLFVID